MNDYLKMGLSGLASVLVAFGAVYTANPNAKPMVVAASCVTALGTYLLGLFQSKPTSGGS